MTLSIRLATAGLGGLFVYASYEPIGWFLAGILGIALLYISLAPWQLPGNLGAPARKRRKNEPEPFLTRLSTGPTVVQGMLLGFAHGLVQYLLLLPWIGEFVGNLPYIALAMVMALYSIAIGAGGVAITRWPRWGVFLFPLFYVAVEYLRSSWPFGGFAWVRLAWGQVNGPLANLTALGGPALVTTATVVVAVGIAVALIGETRRAGAGVAVAVLLVGMVASFYVHRDGTTTDTIEVAAVQGNVPRMGLDFNAQRRAVLANHVRETKNLDQQVDLVIWPENSSDVNPFTDVAASTLITSAVQDAQAPILVGTITRDEVGPRNTMIVFDPDTGVGEHHNKKYLQPFGEYMPYREFFRMFSPLVDTAGNFQPGDGTGTVSMDAAKLGRAVVVGIQTCYEVIFDQAGRDAIANGAEFLATPTNNATFGFTDMTYQQLAMSRMRAIEFDRAVVVAATSGVSAIVNPDGSVEQSTRIFEAATLTAEIPLKQTVTLAARVGFYVELVLVIIGSLAGIAALWLNVRSRTTASQKKPVPSNRKKSTAGAATTRTASVRASTRRK